MLSVYKSQIIEDNNFYLDKNEKCLSNLGDKRNTNPFILR